MPFFIALIVLCLLAEMWAGIMAYAQFGLVGAGAGLAGYGLLALSAWHCVQRAQSRDLCAELPKSLFHVASLTPPRVHIQEGGAERHLGQSAAEAKGLLTIVTSVISALLCATAFHSLELDFSCFEKHYAVGPWGASLWVTAGAWLTVRELRSRFDPNAWALARATVGLQQGRAGVEALVAEATRARDAALVKLRDEVSSLDVPFDAAPHQRSLPLPADPEMLLCTVRADACRIQAQAAAAAPQVKELGRLRAQLKFLERDLDGAPASRGAREAARALDDAYAVLRMLGRSLGTPGQTSVVEETRELERFIDDLEHEVDAACRATAAGGSAPKAGTAACPPSAYRVLGVHPGASPAEIKAAYRRKAHENHPDRGGCPAKFRAVVQAYEALSGARAASHP